MDWRDHREPCALALQHEQDVRVGLEGGEDLEALLFVDHLHG